MYCPSEGILRYSLQCTFILELVGEIIVFQICPSLRLVQCLAFAYVRLDFLVLNRLMASCKVSESTPNRFAFVDVEVMAASHRSCR